MTKVGIKARRNGLITVSFSRALISGSLTMASPSITPADACMPAQPSSLSVNPHQPIQSGKLPAPPSDHHPVPQLDAEHVVERMVWRKFEIDAHTSGSPSALSKNKDLLRLNLCRSKMAPVVQYPTNRVGLQIRLTRSGNDQAALPADRQKAK